MPDAIHASLAELQASFTETHTAQSRDGSVRAEATARRQTALYLSPGALRLSPSDLAELILETQREAQSAAEAAVSSRLDGFRADPRVSTALDSLRDAQALPTPPPTRRPSRDDDENYTVSVYNSNTSW
ncbi:hypothetical protein BLA60_03425 [Actinophytocola xinjiangensis]|uniref:YbaB/EbfC DNA-binding family protein n=1 Tax=Actinophytocola xinjiangensis TaxID=485602 RepID=A0A7Z0WRZ9_9PSEU|nr:YbaB/EbfC family nucleoid-associated protein [Actinophytocola xinjiangensis]OLF14205.1 hypothetical protein BLA60_03425 [Actinophytocola xinjiangensis]